MKTKDDRKAQAKIAVMDMLLDDIQYHPTDQKYADGALNALDAILKCIDAEEDQPEMLAIKPEPFDLNGKTWTLNLDIDKDKWRQITGEAAIKA